MKICSYLTDSFTEYEGEYSLVIFTKECNLNCYGCYNKDIMQTNNLSFEETLNKFITPLHTAIVFLGGEPTCNKELREMIGYVRDNYPTLKIKLYTNGLNLTKLKEVAKDLDSFSVDFKTWCNENNLLGVKDSFSTEDYRTKVVNTLDYLYTTGKLDEIRTVTNPLLKDYELSYIKEFVKEHYPDTKHIISTFIEPHNIL